MSIWDQLGNMKMELDIENMTISEYLEYEAAKERRLRDGVRSRRSPTNYDEADVDSFHWNKSMTFSYPYSYNLTPPHRCFLPVQRYPKNYFVSTNESNDDDDSEEDQEEDGDDRGTFDMWDITVEDVERTRKFFNVPDEIDEIIQPLIPEPIHTIPPNDDYVAPATKSILEEFRDEILNVTMVDDEADFNPTKDLGELERLLAKEPHHTSYAHVAVLGYLTSCEEASQTRLVGCYTCGVYCIMFVAVSVTVHSCLGYW
ncbi:hypothetical protein Tco_0418009 [Tanacetum coccineum]